MAQASSTTLTVKDSTGSTATMSLIADPNNSSAKASKVVVDEALNAKATFATGANSFTLPATPTDVVEIAGSATKTIRIKKIILSGVATTAKQWPVKIIRRVSSIADGVAVTAVAAKFDTSDPAATAVARHFTTLGTLVAANPINSVLFAADMTLTAPATATAPLVFDFSRNMDKALVLRGAADCVVINLGGGALTAGEKLSWACEFEEDLS